MKVKIFLHVPVIILMAVLAISCSNKLEKNITVSTEGEFPVIQIENANGKSVSFVSSAERKDGSIGYTIDGKTIWIEGMPEITESSENTVNYNWSVPNDNAVILTVKREDEDLDLTLQLKDTTVKPSGWKINFSALEQEYFTGVFERVVDGRQQASWADNIKTALNLRGERMDVKLKPTVSAYAPFYISSENYAFFARGTWPGVIDFCKEDSDKVKIAFEGPSFSFKIYSADNPMDLVRKHALETGPSILPPKWAFGPWRWRDQHFNNKNYYDGTSKKAPFNTDIVEDVLMMEAFDIPATAHWIDRPWGPGSRGFDDYKFDTTEFPDPQGMINWMNSKDLELMLWIGPFVMGNMADYAEEHGYYQESKPWHNSRQILMDFTNPEAVKWWGENGPGKLARMGVKGFKLDRADGEKLTDSLHLKTFIGTSYRENYNDYPRQYVKATYEAVKSVLDDNFVLFPRAQYTGSARYGAMWAGDTDGKQEGLRSAIIGMQRCAVMGYPLWGSDIGGYWGMFSRETTMRWIAFGCFSPIMETGPTNNKGFWSNPQDPAYDIELIATWRLYSKVRMKLTDYLHDQALLARNTGTPIVSPLFLKYPEQQEAWNDWQTYLLGPDILVSAIWESRAEKHELYLPKGEIWVDAWDTSKEYAGGLKIIVDAPLYKIPVFIRKGSSIHLGDLKEIYSESIKIASKKPDLEEMEKKEGWR